MAVTFNMILEALEGWEQLCLPAQMERGFDALIAPGQQLRGIPAASALVLAASQDLCAQTLEAGPQCCALCVLGSEEALLPQLAESGRCLAVRAESAAVVEAELWALFQELAAWQQAMQAALLQGGGYQELLDLSTPLLGCPIVMSDIGLQIVAYTRNLLPPETVIQEALRRGSFDERTIKGFQMEGFSSMWDEVQGLTLVEQTTSHRDYPIVFYVFRIHGNYYLHLTLHLADRSWTPGLRDRVQVLVDTMERHIQSNPPAETLFEESVSAVLSDCARGVSLVNRKARTAFASRGFKDGVPFTVSLVEYGYQPQERQVAALRAMELMAEMPSALVALDKARVIVLAEAGSGQSALEQHLRQRDAIVVQSDTFSALKSVPFAYSQAAAGLEAASAFAYPRGCIHTFTTALPDYALIAGAADRGLLESFLAESIAARIIRGSKEEGTDDVRLLRCYLECERRMTVAAERLFIHRNTLTYRIERMVKLYGLELDSAPFRRRLMIEFRLLDRVGA